MLQLSPEQIQHAIGISGSRQVTLGAVTAGKLTMMKNTADPLATQSGVLAALLARRGYTGPEHVLDGKEGLTHVLGPAWKLEVLTDGLGDDWRIRRCGMKAYPTEALTHTPISAVLGIVNDNDLRPEDVAHIEIRSLSRAADILADPSKYDPRSKETADHSLPYCIAAALVDREVTPAQFEPARILDPTIRAQLPKIRVIADPEIERVFPALQRTHVTITTLDGRAFEREIDYPKGNPRNPLSDAEVEAKFDSLAAPLIDAYVREQIKARVWNLDTTHGLNDLTGLCVATASAEPALA
jgi:2-methylcitrate dehydratase